MSSPSDESPAGGGQVEESPALPAALRQPAGASHQSAVASGGGGGGAAAAAATAAAPPSAAAPPAPAAPASSALAGAAGVYSIDSSSAHAPVGDALPGGAVPAGAGGEPIFRLDALDELPRVGRRIKLTCLATSASYLAVGTSTGNVYVYDRSSLNIVKILPIASDSSEPDPIVVIRFCPLEEDELAVATQSGLVLIVDGQFGNLKEQKPRVLCKNKLHRETRVTDLLWDDSGLRLFSSDAGGVVCQSTLKGRIGGPASATITRMSSNLNLDLFQSCEVLTTCESAVVQLALEQDVLVCSTLTRCLVVDLSKAPPREATQVGRKKREGEFGACFDPNSNGRLLLAARPGKRVWVADVVSGQVISTLKFKLPDNSSVATPFLEMSSPSSTLRPNASTVKQVQVSRIHQLRNFVMSWAPSNVLLLDTAKVKVLHWLRDLGTILDVSCSDDDAQVYILHLVDDHGGKAANARAVVSSLSIVPAETYVTDLFARNEHEACIRAIMQQQLVKLALLEQISSGLDTSNPEFEPYFEYVASVRRKYDQVPKRTRRTDGNVHDGTGAGEADSGGPAHSRSPLLLKTLDNSIPFPLAAEETSPQKSKGKSSKLIDIAPPKVRGSVAGGGSGGGSGGGGGGVRGGAAPGLQQAKSKKKRKKRKKKREKKNKEEKDEEVNEIQVETDTGDDGASRGGDQDDEAGTTTTAADSTGGSSGETQEKAGNGAASSLSGNAIVNDEDADVDVVVETGAGTLVATSVVDTEEEKRARDQALQDELASWTEELERAELLAEFERTFSVYSKCCLRRRESYGVLPAQQVLPMLHDWLESLDMSRIHAATSEHVVHQRNAAMHQAQECMLMYIECQCMLLRDQRAEGQARDNGERQDGDHPADCGARGDAWLFSRLGLPDAQCQAVSDTLDKYIMAYRAATRPLEGNGNGSDSDSNYKTAGNQDLWTSSEQFLEFVEQRFALFDPIRWSRLLELFGTFCMPSAMEQLHGLRERMSSTPLLSHTIDAMIESGSYPEALALLKRMRDPILFARFVRPLLAAYPVETLLFCAQMYPDVPPWMVAVGLHIDKSAPKDMTDKGVSQFLRYVDAVMHGHREAHEDEELLIEWCAVALTHGAPSLSQLVASTLASPIAAPAPGCFACKWEHQEVLDRVCSESFGCSFDVVRMASLFARHGYFRGVFALLLRKGVESCAYSWGVSGDTMVAMLLELCMCADDLGSLSELCTSPRFSSAHWVQLFALLADGGADVHERSVAPSEAMQLMLQSMGPADAIALLVDATSRVDKERAVRLLHPGGEAGDLSLFQIVIDAVDRREQQQAVAHEMLEQVNGYLWTRGAPELHIPPQIRATRDVEERAAAESDLEPLSAFVDLQMDQHEDVFDNRVSRGPHSSARASASASATSAAERAKLRFDYNSGAPRFFEELGMSTHWGAGLQLGGTKEPAQRCFCCNLRLAAMQVVVFPCGHAFHTACVPEMACVRCFTESFSIL